MESTKENTMKVEWKPIPLRVFNTSIKPNFSKMNRVLANYIKDTWDEFNIPIFGVFLPGAKRPIYTIVLYLCGDKYCDEEDISIYEEITREPYDPFFCIPVKKYIKGEKYVSLFMLIKNIENNLQFFTDKVLNYHNKNWADILGPYSLIS